MSFAPFNTPDNLLGSFCEKDHGMLFEYSEDTKAKPVWDSYPHKVWVSDKKIGGDQQFRWAFVLKTVAHIVIDEEADGSPRVEKWAIKNHRTYS